MSVTPSHDTDTMTERPSLFRLALLAGLGGTIGTGLRATLTLYVFPGAEILTVFLINTVGSFLLGTILPLTSRRVGVFLGTGLLGGFTTYSALSLSTVQLASHGAPSTALLLAAGTMIAGVTSALLGMWVADAIMKRPGRMP